MQVNIYQGRATSPQVAEITIVIDVIRAFTVAHYAFLQGASSIYLAETVEQALQISEKQPELLLAGEVGGLPIEGFDLDNSPYDIIGKNLKSKALVQVTTNGVRATLNNLSSKQVFVTGFANAKQTALFIKANLAAETAKINIIASHPSGDDDLACAEYISSILKGSDAIKKEEVIKRILHSPAAEKFFDKNEPDYKQEDILLCTKELNSRFVMEVNKLGKIPSVERVEI
jgi:2-phosphosulfolactate phosphatase